MDQSRLNRDGSSRSRTGSGSFSGVDGIKGIAGFGSADAGVKAQGEGGISDAAVFRAVQVSPLRRGRCCRAGLAAFDIGEIWFERRGDQVVPAAFLIIFVACQPVT